MAKGKYAEWITPDGLLKLEAWARDGLTDEQIAHNMGITRKTIGEWKNQYSCIRDALKKGKEVVDIEVENALHKRALGYTAKVKKTFKVRISEFDKITGKKIREYEELQTGIDEVHIPADTTAQIFWLKNRKPDKWRDKPLVTQGEDIDDDPLSESIREGVENGTIGKTNTDT